MVAIGTHFHNGCCFDYGKRRYQQTANKRHRSTWDAVYFGNLVLVSLRARAPARGCRRSGNGLFGGGNGTTPTH